jgi:hypothetical protein
MELAEGFRRHAGRGGRSDAGEIVSRFDQGYPS